MLTERVELGIANKSLTVKLGKADNQLKELNESVVTDHEEGFNKALRQVILLLGVDLVAKGFDIMKDVHEENLIPLEEMLGNLFGRA